MESLTGSNRVPKPGLVRQFRLLDTHHTGTITKDELADAMERYMDKGAAEVEADNILKQYDHRHSGGLELDEFAEFVHERYGPLHDIFCELDISNTGSITLDDVKEGLKRAHVPHMDSDVARVLSRLGGTDSDGKEGVSFAHFFEASLLLPVLKTNEVLASVAGVIPFRQPPPGTTPGMVVAAGMINGMVSRTMTAPMDRLRAVLATGREGSVFDAARTIFRTQGLRGFWSSNLANVVQVAPENGITFVMNDVLRDYVCTDASHPTITEKFLLGSVAGAIAMTTVYPMYVVQNRMAAAPVGKYNGMLDCVRRTGMSYAGFGTSLVRVMPLKGIMLGGYGTLKDFAKDPVTGHISTSMSLACSAAAGGLAHSFTYPLHMARTVLQQEVEPGARVYTGAIDVLRHRLGTHGLRGWFLGLPIWLCNRIPAVAIEFAVNERALDLIKRNWK